MIGMVIKKKSSSGELKNDLWLDEQIASLIDSGLIEIGSANNYTCNLPTLSIENKRVEIGDSKTKIEERFKIKCNSFLLSFWFIWQRRCKNCKEFGYTNATEQKGIDDLSKSDLFELKRITVSGKDSLIAFKIKLKRRIERVRIN